jgi:hypothetical protein
VHRRRDLYPRSISFPPLPKAKIEHHVQTEFKASRPDFFHLFTNASIQFRVVLDRGIIAVKAGHPFVTREADRWNPLLKMSSKGGLTDTEKAMNQVSRCHRERQY